jgi:dihydrolipoamide dehydrogenase
MQNFDLIVIGGGRASNLAIKAAKKGRKVALIEKSKLGGTCPNRGCVPSKLLIGYANAARSIRESKRHFINSKIQGINVEQIFKETNKYIKTIDPGYESRFNENAQIFRGEGKFISNKIISVNGEKLTAPNIVIATGTRPNKPLHVKAWSSDDIFPLTDNVPKSITIVGAGFIACELANFFSAVGVKTKLLVRGDKLLKNEDSEISGIFKTQFCNNVDVAFETSIKDIKYKNDMFILTLIDKNKNISTHVSEALLYATGRISNADKLGLENTDIKLDERGFIKRDEFFETSVKGVYVVGDASGIYMLQHAAAYEVNYLGKILLENCKEPLVFKYMPHAVFSDPEIASVGLSEQKAKEKCIEYVATTTNWLASAKAMSLRINYPRTKLLINPKTYEILGAHLIGPESATMIHQILAIMHLDNDIRHLKDMLYIHPALSEALLPAAVAAVKKVEEYIKK